MTSEDFRLYWPGISLRARESCRGVTDEDIQIIDGEEALFFGIVGSRCGWNRPHIERWLRENLRDMLGDEDDFDGAFRTSS